VTILSADLTVDFRSGRRVLSGVEFSLVPGEVLAIAGRSGSGKSTLAMALMGLLDRRHATLSGHVKLGDVDLLQLREQQLRAVRGRRIGLVLQAASSALNPYVRIGDHIREAWHAHQSGNWNSARSQALDMLRRLDVDCDEEFLRRYPGQISIGQAQRVLIAMAVLHNPAVLIADEPTSALDPIAASEVLDLLRRLSQELGMGVVYISHDIASVARLCHRVIVLEHGRVLEQGPTASVLTSPRTEYVRRLVGTLRANVGVGVSAP
jgi:ABC-type glutathione transport system ATPase component